jgi:hypothetical protein
MGDHRKKFIAPIAVVVCLSFYYVIAGIMVWKLNIPTSVKIMVLMVSVIITILLIVVLIERIKEIDKGEEDDLGKY